MTALICTCCYRKFETDLALIEGRPPEQWWSEIRHHRCRMCMSHDTACLIGLQRPGRAHRNGIDTEREAADQIAPITGVLRTQALALLEQHPDGLTDDEGGVLLGGDRLKFGRRRQELCSAGLVTDSGRRRLTPSGRRAAVWVRTAETSEKGQQ